MMVVLLQNLFIMAKSRISFGTFLANATFPPALSLPLKVPAIFANKGVLIHEEETTNSLGLDINLTPPAIWSLLLFELPNSKGYATCR
ncbi:exported hypothetical protein [Candidatus Desulfosporosinus infrequens]|uniref:Uncharacterized protein n=1 Tax=Candidatus Desulfosporosinus infrequens TaxID=2043169 RepID=A0A2U3LKK7_9FIRM|nr:exported hypothetical protein [Candidatus Desulfosporosinus infrequens]